MLIKLLKWYQGYLLIWFHGFAPERFLNLCRNKNIFLWGLHQTDDGYECYISLKGFLQIRPIARKTKTRPVIRRRIGFPFYFQKYKKRKALLLGIVTGCFMIYIMSLFIWNISIEGQSYYTEEAMLAYLKEQGVFCGVLKNKISCQDIEEKIRLTYPDIGWVSVEMEGTSLNLRLVETNMPVPYETIDTPSHLIASHKGKIVSIMTRSGTPMVKKGDDVEKGDILVSGVLEILDDNKEVKAKEAVVADADIRLQTEYQYEDMMELETQKEKYTGKIHDIYGISLLGKKIFIYRPFNTLKTDRKYDIIVNDVDVKVNRSFYLPISFCKKEYREYEWEQKIYTEEEAKAILEKRFQTYIDKLEKQEVVIKENNVKTTVANGKMIAKGSLVVEEPVTEYQTVKEDEWRLTITDELDGNDN